MARSAAGAGQLNPVLNYCKIRKSVLEMNVGLAMKRSRMNFYMKLTDLILAAMLLVLMA
jgi:hypothetical protein